MPSPASRGTSSLRIPIGNVKDSQNCSIGVRFTKNLKIYYPTIATLVCILTILNMLSCNCMSLCAGTGISATVAADRRLAGALVVFYHRF